MPKCKWEFCGIHNRPCPIRDLIDPELNQLQCDFLHFLFLTRRATLIGGYAATHKDVVIKPDTDTILGAGLIPASLITLVENPPITLEQLTNARAKYKAYLDKARKLLVERKLNSNG